MDLKVLQEKLSENFVLLRTYVDHNSMIEMEKNRIMRYSNRRKHIILGVFFGYLTYLLAYHFLISSDQVVITGLICFGGFVIAMRYVIGPLYDRNKRRQMKHTARLRFEPLVIEMDLIALKMQQCDLLPDKYKTFHAVSHLKSYVENRRIESLKEGFNLYEQELNSYYQQQSLDRIVYQQQKILSQQKIMIQQQQQMIQAQRTTNTLLWFR